MDILKYLMENSDERFTKQIQYIMDQLSMADSKEKAENLSKSQEALSESNDEDNDVDDLDEDDDLVEEEELEESIHLEKSFPLGEDLLNKYFSLPMEAADKQKLIIKSIVQEQQKSLNVSRSQDKSLDNVAMFKRPTTPSLISNNASSVDNNLHAPSNPPRDLPSELRPRPKLVRTPLEGLPKPTPALNQDSLLEESKANDSKALIYMESPFMDQKKIELRVISL